ncbi:MAG: sigma-70 family RNA polymerase sigma factor [Rhodothermales bacterium]|nr:sigma-70 family RNA polymerase sigma factor [Rhodothermales bacterium]MBO6778046.1 sigma-70 family RNA polymerase sigma factor [Rhodothermales bacterium]
MNTPESMISDSDSNQLLQAVSRGDRDAFETLFRRYQAKLTGYATSMCGDRSLALDVLQDVFMKLWDTRRRLRSTGSAEALLYTMVRNRTISLIRRRRPSAELTVVAESAAPVFDPAQGREMQQFFQRWMDELPPRRKEAFLLSRDHGLTHRQIARVLGVTEKTVDAHILRTLQFLRERLTNYRQEAT